MQGYTSITIKGNQMNKLLQRTIQVVFLLLFILLLIKGRIQIWMGIYLVSFLASFIFSRFYCGWICPINTLLKPITWAKKKLHIKSVSTPGIFAKTWVRILMLSLFLAALALAVKTGKKLPVLPVLVGFGVVITLLFSEEFFHRYLCPYGFALSLTSRTAKKGMVIDAELCNNCGMCKRVCPSLAVVKDGKHRIITNDCLVCKECERNCKQEAIKYRTIK